MNINEKKINKYFLYFMLGQILFLFLISMILQFTEMNNLLKIFRVKFLLNHSLKFVLKNLNILFYVTIVAVVNIFLSQYYLKKKQPEISYSDYSKVFSIWVLILFLIIFLSGELIIPKLSTNINRYYDITELTQRYKEKAKELEAKGVEADKKGNDKLKAMYYKEALKFYKQYLYYDSEDLETIDSINSLRHEDTYVEKRTKEEKFNINEIEGLYSKGLYYFKEKEYLIAQYYLEKYAFYFSDDVDALKLLEKAREYAEKERTKKDVKKSEILDLKIKGIRLMNDGEYIESFRIFDYLHNKYPNNDTIKPYYLESKQLYNTLDFFISDITEFEKYPGIHKILIKVKDENSKSYLVYFDKVVNYLGDTYMYNIQVINLMNSRLYNYRYGKKVSNYVVLKNTNNKLLLDYNLSYNHILSLKTLDSPDTFSIIKYFSLRELALNSGYKISKVDILLVKRILMYFLFLSFSYIVFVYSYNNRLSKDGFPSIGQICMFGFTVYIVFFILFKLVKILLVNSFLIISQYLSIIYSLILIMVLLAIIVLIWVKSSVSKFSD